jgi:hypothetical protein
MGKYENKVEDEGEAMERRAVRKLSFRNFPVICAAVIAIFAHFAIARAAAA